MSAWLETVATQLLGTGIPALGELLFRTPALDALPAVRETWGLVRGVADALFVLAWLGAGILVMISGGTEARYTAKVLIPRVLLAAILANASLALCGALIGLNNALVAALLGPKGSALFGEFAAGLTVGDPLNAMVGILVGIVAAVLALLLVALFIARAVLLLLLLVLAPLALATHALPQTSEIARLWWRVFLALLFVQVIQAVLVAVAVLVLAHAEWIAGPANALVAGLLAVTVLYLLFRLPFATYEWVVRRPVQESRIAQTVLFARALAML